jgi:cytochrome c oxidase subunit 2
MDAIPGLPTFFVFRPITTTKEFRKNLKNYPEWRTPYDPEDPESKERWEMFDYELACAELCGKSHYAMRRIVEIVTREEYNEWMAEKNTKPYYRTTIRGTDADPRKGELLDIEKKNRNIELTSEFTLATESESLKDKIINLKNIFYETGSATLDNQSQSELDKLSQLLAQFPSVNAQIISHTDILGDADLNYTLSESRAGNVRQYLLNKGINADRLSSVGFGEIQPIESNGSPEARESNGRTELRIISNLIVKN